jgi:hypothetical protein
MSIQNFKRPAMKFVLSTVPRAATLYIPGLIFETQKYTMPSINTLNVCFNRSHTSDLYKRAQTLK